MTPRKIVLFVACLLSLARSATTQSTFTRFTSFDGPAISGFDFDGDGTQDVVEMAFFAQSGFTLRPGTTCHGLGGPAPIIFVPLPSVPRLAVVGSTHLVAVYPVSAMTATVRTVALFDLAAVAQGNFTPVRTFPTPAIPGAIEVFAPANLDLQPLPDIVVASPGETVSGGTLTGVVRAYSSATGGLLFFRNGPAPGAFFGLSVTRLSDLDGDGRPELAVSAPRHPTAAAGIGSIHFISGANGASMGQVVDPVMPAINDSFATVLTTLDDVDGDGRLDIVASHRQAAFVLSGANGAVMQVLLPPNPIAAQGVVCGNAGDQDGDGAVEVALYADTGSGDALSIHDASTGTLIAGPFVFPGLIAPVESLRTAGDHSGDGRDELILGDALVGATMLAGSDEDFQLDLALGLLADCPVVEAAHVLPGDLLTVRMHSPLGAFTFYPPVFAGQFYFPVFPPPPIATFPTIHLHPALSPAPFLIFDGTGGAFGSSLLPPAGLSFLYFIPAGLTGGRLRLQAIIVSPFAANGVFAASRGYDVVFL